ncbi:ABC transporter permease [Bacillus marinisedimentorum]|uniref:ABC transporter permease n=1 Tax=Bacillus marinisedimentorum TaxID=1821260 RepID=UPI00087232F1|nr:ABC transporter permease [Bacillus marinisedimentorum]
MPAAIFGSVESGIIYAIMALGVYISFRILDFPDLTVDGSFVTGAAVAAIMITTGSSPVLATFAGAGAGFAAGTITGLLHTKGKINPLLSGILMMIALYSINLRIMGRPNVPLLNQETGMTAVGEWSAALGIDGALNGLYGMIFTESYLPATWGILLAMIVVTFSIKLLLDWFLKTEIGLALRATGNNKQMIRSHSANTDRYIVAGLGLSNGLVAFSGALIAQYSSFADVGMGIGMIIIGLASVIIGEALFGTKSIARTTLAVIGGAVIYRIVVSMALRVEFLETGDMKMITAAIVVLALIVPKWVDARKEKRRKEKRRAERVASIQERKQKGGDHIAAAATDQQSV